MGLAAAACTLLGMGASEAAVTYSWQQSGPDVLLSVTGTMDVTGWTNVTNSNSETGARFDNYTYTDPMIGQVTSQDFQLSDPYPNQPILVSPSGSLVLSPWQSLTGAQNVIGTHESGEPPMYWRILGGDSPTAYAYFPTNEVVSNSVSINSQYKFSGQTLDGMFGSGFTWGGGAHIATIGGNQVNFQVVPEPSSSLLVAGAALIFATSRRRKRHA